MSTIHKGNTYGAKIQIRVVLLQSCAFNNDAQWLL